MPRATGTSRNDCRRSIPPPACAAIAANDDDRIIADCGALIDNEKTAKADRIKALIARAGAFDRKDQIDRAIGDYDACCGSIPRWPRSSTPAASCGARRATGRRRWPISAPRSSSTRTIAAARGNYKRWRWSWSGSAR